MGTDGTRPCSPPAGANWVQGTQTGNGPANPIWTLAQKHNLKTHFNDWFGSISESAAHTLYSVMYQWLNNHSDVQRDGP